MYCLTVSYPKSDDSHFDHEYYTSKHIPLCQRLFANHGLCGYVLRSEQGKGPGSGDLTHACIDIMFESAEKMQAALAAGGAEVSADVPNYTNANAQMSFAEISVSV